MQSWITGLNEYLQMNKRWLDLNLFAVIIYSMGPITLVLCVLVFTLLHLIQLIGYSAALKFKIVRMLEQ